ncbi:uncharacterized protein LOC130808870 isoform X1 [Amaranthus tricolor]|uniref:uncharacterized protein LOC130808870 isoform X1 n=2 Tax=Amaranthus tricolor TaxID=29722 RepID=UPI002587C055|nr:uncharacterized protein LOC130808870 isoform X1 [Amaranthus tricolor]
MRNYVKKLRSAQDVFCPLIDFGCRMVSRKPHDSLRLIATTSTGIFFGFVVGVYVSLLSVSKINPVNYLPVAILPTTDQHIKVDVRQNSPLNSTIEMPIRVQSNPTGAERLPPGIVESKSDLFPRRLWGLPSEDLPTKPKYLVAFTVGLDMKENIDVAVKKFSDNFTIALFHYDGKTSEWDQFEWSKHAIHVSVPKQTKWWYAKRFLHPDIVAPYEYIFIWDEDLGVDNFDAEKYIEIAKKHGLEISQPGVDPKSPFTWQMTRKRNDSEVHKVTEEKPGWCKDPHLPPCAAFVEIMAPVFSRKAWRCVWHMIQNDLVHGWGMDFALRKCVEPAFEKIGVVDTQWIVHKRVPSLGSQGESKDGLSPWQGVRRRCEKEWKMFEDRVSKAEKAHKKNIEASS